MERKCRKIKIEWPTFLEKMLPLKLKQLDFVQIFSILKDCAEYCLDPEPESEPKLFEKSEQ